MSSKPDGDWKYILCYRDHGTKICFLRPLATKTVRSVAWALLDIFSVIAPPVRLQTDNGLEFSNIANAAADSGGGDAADGISEEMVPFFFLPLAPCPHCGIINFEIEINDFNLKIIDFNLKINDFNLKIIDFNLEIDIFNLKIIDFNLEINDLNLKIIDFNLEILSKSFAFVRCVRLSTSSSTCGQGPYW